MRPERPWLVLIVAAVLIAWGALYWRGGIAETPPSRPAKAVGPMVQLLGPTGFAIVWELRGPGPASLELTGPGGYDRRVEMTYEEGHHIARLDGLLAGSEYAYRVSGPDEETGEWLSFEGVVRTPATDCDAFRFAALGDSGGGGGPQLRVEWCIRQHEPDLIIHTGDLIYPVGAKEAYPSRFFKPYAQLIANVPFWPSLGNHDVATDDGGPFLQTFVLPENGPEGLEERCYWFEYCNARFVALDTNQSAEGLEERVAPWLAEVLAEAATEWKFVFFHHPVYTSSTHAPCKRVYRYLIPVIEAGGVDAVFAGHNHLYERCHPIRGDEMVPPGEGVLYVTTGGGGMSVYAERLPNPDYIAAYYDDDFSFTLVDIEGSRLSLRQINSANQVVDEWSYDKSQPAGTADPTGMAQRGAN